MPGFRFPLPDVSVGEPSPSINPERNAAARRPHGKAAALSRKQGRSPGATRCPQAARSLAENCRVQNLAHLTDNLATLDQESDDT